jgi:hypothetical protein
MTDVTGILSRTTPASTRNLESVLRLLFGFTYYTPKFQKRSECLEDVSFLYDTTLMRGDAMEIDTLYYIIYSISMVNI